MAEESHSKSNWSHWAWGICDTNYIWMKPCWCFIMMNFTITCWHVAQKTLETWYFSGWLYCRRTQLLNIWTNIFNFIRDKNIWLLPSNCLGENLHSLSCESSTFCPFCPSATLRCQKETIGVVWWSSWRAPAPRHSAGFWMSRKLEFPQIQSMRTFK